MYPHHIQRYNNPILEEMDKIKKSRKESESVKKAEDVKVKARKSRRSKRKG